MFEFCLNCLRNLWLLISILSDYPLVSISSALENVILVGKLLNSTGYSRWPFNSVPTFVTCNNLRSILHMHVSYERTYSSSLHSPIAIIASKASLLHNLRQCTSLSFRWCTRLQEGWVYKLPDSNRSSAILMAAGRNSIATPASFLHTWLCA